MRRIALLILLVLGLTFPGLAAEIKVEVDESTGSKYTYIMPCWLVKKYEWFLLALNLRRVSDDKTIQHGFQVIYIGRVKRLSIEKGNPLIIRIGDDVRRFPAAFVQTRVESAESAFYLCTLDDMREIVDAFDEGKTVEVEVVGSKRSQTGKLSRKVIVDYKKFLDTIDPDWHYQLSKKKPKAKSKDTTEPPSVPTPPEEKEEVEVTAISPQQEEIEKIRIMVLTRLRREYFAHLEEVLEKREDCQLLQVSDLSVCDTLNTEPGCRCIQCFL